jgi:hypothetical protein
LPTEEQSIRFPGGALGKTQNLQKHATNYHSGVPEVIGKPRRRTLLNPSLAPRFRLQKRRQQDWFGKNSPLCASYFFIEF